MSLLDSLNHFILCFELPCHGLVVRDLLIILPLQVRYLPLHVIIRLLQCGHLAQQLLVLQVYLLFLIGKLQVLHVYFGVHLFHGVPFIAPHALVFLLVFHGLFQIPNLVQKILLRLFRCLHL